MALLIKASLLLLAASLTAATIIQCPSVDDPERDVLLADLDDCTSYFICHGGRPVQMRCPHGLHFSPELLRCEYPEEAGCSVPPSQPKPEPATRPETRPNDPACPPPGPGPLVLYPHPNNCTKYQICDNGRLVTMQCPVGLHFNTDLEVCDEPRNVGCRGAWKSPELSQLGVRDKSDVCPPSGEGDLVLLPDPKDCSQYFACDNGLLVTMPCPPGLHFNPELKVCELPSDAGCSIQFKVVYLTPIRFDTSITGNEALNECPPPGNVGLVLFPDPKNCSQYQICDNGNLVTRPCPPGLEFNPVVKVCDHPALAGCKVKLTHIPASISSGIFHTFSEVCPPPGESDLVMFPDPKNCSQYLVCDNGQLTVRPCSPGLHYNPESQVCEFPSEVGCKETSQIFSKGSLDASERERPINVILRKRYLNHPFNV